MTQAVLSNPAALPFREEAGYRYIRFAECYLEITENGTANVMATLKSLMGADRVSMIVYLQRFDGDWTTIKKWETGRRGSYLTFFESVKIQKGIGYRIQVYSYADKGPYSECMVSEFGKVF